MKKKLKILSVLSILTVFVFTLFYNISDIKAATASGTLVFDSSENGKAYYGGSTDGSGYYWTNWFKVTGVTNDAGEFNAFCLDPAQTPISTGSSITGTEVTDADLKKLAWFSFGAPGFLHDPDTIRDLYEDNYLTHHKEDDGIIYGLSHAILSVYDGGDGSSISVNHQLINNTRDDVLDLAIHDQTAYSNFHVYISRQGNHQDILFWSYEEETTKAYIKVKKDFSPDSTASVTFKLYKCASVGNDGKCTSQGAQIGQPVTITEGQTGKLGLDANGNALLDTGTPYLIWEDGEKDGKKGDYNVSFSNVTSTVTLRYTDGHDYTYGQISVGTGHSDTIGYYNSTVATVTNTKDEKGYIEIQKKVYDGSTEDTDFDFSTYHFKFEIYDGNTKKCTVFTNNQGKATCGLDNGEGTLPAGKTYTIKEAVNDNGNAKMYDSNGTEIASRPVVKPTFDASGENVTIRYVGEGTAGKNTVELENKYRTCVQITKTDGGTNKLAGASFNLYSDSECSGTVIASGTTNANGVLKFNNLPNKRYFVKETAAPTGYNLLSACTQVTAHIIDEAGACGSKTIANEKLYVGWYKIKEDETPLTEATFKLKNSSNQYVTVNGTEDGCWKYSGTSSTGSILTVNNTGTGYYCISGIPSGTYTAEEQATGNDGYWIDGGTVSVTSSTTKVMTKATSNTVKNKPYVVTFYKVRESVGTPIQNTKFKIKEDGTNNYITVNGKSATSGYTDCYVYTGTTNESGASELSTDANGRICVIRVKKNTTYEMIETESGDPAYYMDTSTSFKVASAKNVTTKNNNNTLTNKAYHLSFYKVREDGTPLSGAKFRVKNGNKFVKVSGTDSDGCYIYNSLVDSESSAGDQMVTDTNGRICLVRVPNVSGYKAVEKETGNPAYYIFENGTIDLVVSKDIQGKTNANSIYNKPYVINFYKVVEKNNQKVGGAEFVITDGSGKYVEVEGTSTTSDYNGCYIYKGLSNTKTNLTKLISSSENKQNGIEVGEVCVIRIPNGTYKVTETKPVEYHTFGEVTTKNIATAKTRVAMNTDRSFINEKTEFKFNKTVAEENGYDTIWEEMTTSEIMKIPFTIYDSNGNAVSVIKTAEGKYEYAGNTIDGVSGDSTTTLNLDSNRELYVYHLPKGTYTIKEAECCCEDTCESPSNSVCYGYYAPNYRNKTASSYTFTINDCSTSKTTGVDETGSNVCQTSISTSTLDNSPTEVDFTKQDFYSYVDGSETVKFEDSEEISAFDGITFKVYYIENGEKVYLDFAKVKNVGTCETEESYAEYRYIPSDTDSSIKNRLEITKELHTCGGHIKITHLCRGRKYYIEEVSVPGTSVFTLPEREEDRTKELDLECCKESETEKPTTTEIIEDKPTKVGFEKRDSKYGYLIADETTTFEVYRCNEGVSCHPSDYTSVEERANAGISLVKFNPRGLIANDEEDPGVEVYRFVTNDSNVSNYETELHPYRGKLVLRYLQGGYQYVLLETVSPKGYTLPRGRNRETAFTVNLQTVEVEEVDVANKPTSLLIRKYAEDGSLLAGAQFRIYEGTTCDKNLTPMAQPKELLSLKTIRDGVYENREVKDTNVITTCKDEQGNKCSDIVTTLTLPKYVDTWTNFDNSVNQKDERIEIQEGEILIQYLDYGHCYIIEEVKAPTGYSLPEKEEDRFIMVSIDKDDDVVDTFKNLINKPTPFTFYKYDEYNNLIDGGEFKLQKLNKNKKYEDVTVTEEENEGKLFYKVDKNSENKTIRTNNGSATVYYLEEGQYRIVETKAPEGMELPNKEINVAVFYVDEEGTVMGNSIITNKPKTEKIEYKPVSQAELIVNISTGMERIRYGLIIGVIVTSIIGLIYIQKLKKKEE